MLLQKGTWRIEPQNLWNQGGCYNLPCYFSSNIRFVSYVLKTDNSKQMQETAMWINWPEFTNVALNIHSVLRGWPAKYTLQTYLPYLHNCSGSFSEYHDHNVTFLHKNIYLTNQ